MFLSSHDIIICYLAKKELLVKFSTLDIIVFAGYAVLIIGAALYVSRTKKGEKKTSKDYFLANKSLPWWAVGASLIAANISDAV